MDTGAVLSTRYETLSVGTHTVSAGSTPSGYQAYSSTSTTVTVYSDGTASQGLVTFQYRKKAPVTPTPYNPPAPVGNQVVPTGWDTQFGPGSSYAKGVNYLYRLYDGDPSTNFSYIFWSAEKDDDIPEFTAYFDGATISKIGVTNGLTNATKNERVAKPSGTTIKIYSDEGVTVKVIEFKRGGESDMRQYSLGGTYHNVTKIEIYCRHIWVGQGDTKYEVHITDIAFFE